MSDPYAYQPHGGKKKRSFPWPLIGGGCVLLLLLLGGCVGGFFWMFSGAKTSFTPIMESYLGAYNADEHDRAYHLVSETWRKSQSQDDFIAFHENLKGVLGNYRSIGMNSVNYQMNPGSKTATVVFSAEFDSGPATLTATMVKLDGTWYLQGCHFSSDLFDTTLTCANCGHGNPVTNKHCAQCGEALTSP